MKLGGLRDKCAEHTDCRGMLPQKGVKIYVLSGFTSIWWLFEVNEPLAFQLESTCHLLTSCSTYLASSMECACSGNSSSESQDQMIQQLQPQPVSTTEGVKNRPNLPFCTFLLTWPNMKLYYVNQICRGLLQFVTVPQLQLSFQLLQISIYSV